MREVSGKSTSERHFFCTAVVTAAAECVSQASPNRLYRSGLSLHAYRHWQLMTTTFVVETAAVQCRCQSETHACTRINNSRSLTSMFQATAVVPTTVH